MCSGKIKLYFLITFILIFVPSYINAGEITDNGRENYIRLKAMYEKWDSGLFGSRRYYRTILNRLLIDMIGCEIQTGQDYNISIMDVKEKKIYYSDLYGSKWLYIHGEADGSSIKEFSEKGDKYIKEVERNKRLFFLSGRIEKFRIMETGYGRNIHLYLESVKIGEYVKQP